MKLTIIRKLEIDAGHRLMNHEGKCKNAHGHRYVFEVEVTATGLDAVGRVIDFSVLKTELGGWLDKHWDHAFIWQKGDPIGKYLLAEEQANFPVDFPPTAENLATFFLDKARGLMAGHGIEVVSVRLWETPNCNAHVR